MIRSVSAALVVLLLSACAGAEGPAGPQVARPLTAIPASVLALAAPHESPWDWR